MHGQQNITLVTLVDIVTNVHRKRPRSHHAQTHELPRATGSRVMHIFWSEITTLQGEPQYQWLYAFSACHQPTEYETQRNCLLDMSVT
jgi:hypothetical protein